MFDLGYSLETHIGDFRNDLRFKWMHDRLFDRSDVCYHGVYIIYVKSMTRIVLLLDSTTTGCSFKLKPRMVWTVLALTCTSWPKDGDGDIDPDQADFF